MTCDTANMPVTGSLVNSIPFFEEDKRQKWEICVCVMWTMCILHVSWLDSVIPGHRSCVRSMQNFCIACLVLSYRMCKLHCFMNCEYRMTSVLEADTLNAHVPLSCTYRHSILTGFLACVVSEPCRLAAVSWVDLTPSGNSRLMYV